MSQNFMHKGSIVLLTGSHGFIGRKLLPYLEEQGYAVRTLVRNQKEADGITSFYWNPDRGDMDEKALEGADVLIHLAGTGIGDKRWSAQRKAYILKNRINSASLLYSAMKKSSHPPKVAIIASAVGFYGEQEGTATEQSHTGTGFAASVCQSIESSFPEHKKLRVVYARFGVVLGENGGALAKMLFPFKLGIGGVLGTGKQPFPWVSQEDVLRAMTHCIEKEAISGAVNVTAPAQDTNKSFTKALGKALHRPTILPMPGFVVKMLFGQMGQELLLEGTKVFPEKLKKSGFQFNDTSIENAIKKSL